MRSSKASPFILKDTEGSRGLGREAEVLRGTWAKE